MSKRRNKQKGNIKKKERKGNLGETMGLGTTEEMDQRKKYKRCRIAGFIK